MAYKHLKPEDIPPVPTPEELEADYAGQTLEELAKAMYELEAHLESIDAARAPLYNEYEFLRLRAIPNESENSGVKTVTIQFNPHYVGRVSLTPDLHVQVLDPQAAMQWLKDNGHGGLIKDTVHAGSLKAAIKVRITSAQGTPPEDLFKITPFKRASITKA